MLEIGIAGCQRQKEQRIYTQESTLTIKYSRAGLLKLVTFNMLIYLSSA